MKIVGIIAEYNPFHKGHEFHIEKAKKITGADAAIIIMSGDYVSVEFLPSCQSICVPRWHLHVVPT